MYNNIKDLSTSNAPNLLAAIQYLHKTIQMRLALHFQVESETLPEGFEIAAPSFYEDGSVYARFISTKQFTTEEYIVFLTALVPNLYPGFFEHILQDYIKNSKDDFLVFGGVKGKNYRGIIPTIETMLFILSGGDLAKKISYMNLFEPTHNFYKKNILQILPTELGEPFHTAKVTVTQEVLSLLTTGKTYRPEFSAQFPAKLISTEMNWEDLVLNPNTKRHLDYIRIWLESHQKLRTESVLGKKLKAGFRVLLYGPPGTGKTLTATLLGKQFKKSVYRVDLSQIVSKYIGETEKNLEKIFKTAAHKNWILFFDEADALYGKRTNVNDAHDRFANQEVSYLLQRIEDFPGLIILASNNKENIDEAFTRRFNAIIKFPFPKKLERTQIWEKTFPQDFGFENDQHLPSLLGDYELSGGNIINVVQYACLKTIHCNSKVIKLADVLDGIKIEMSKEGKAFYEIFDI